MTSTIEMVTFQLYDINNDRHKSQLITSNSKRTASETKCGMGENTAKRQSNNERLSEQARQKKQLTKTQQM